MFEFESIFYEYLSVKIRFSECQLIKTEFTPLIFYKIHMYT